MERTRGPTMPIWQRRRALLQLPQENLLYFLEKSGPKLAPWQRECLRIVRLIAQYFYPQGQTKVMNEGCASYVHYEIMNRLHETGQIGDGDMLEFLRSHTNVVYQPEFHERHYSGINPYALGFAMMKDIERICREPTEEDRVWFPDIAGVGDHMPVLRERIWAHYATRASSCISEPASDSAKFSSSTSPDDDTQPALRRCNPRRSAAYAGLAPRARQQYDVAALDAESRSSRCRPSP